jgi:oxygen-independent coproporphyrinogen-3 oxidase
LSLGVQSFAENDLVTLGRLHDVGRSLAAFALARSCGFDSINLDLMYGFPGHTLGSWESSLEKALDLGSEHISTYCFILEEGTRFWPAHEAGQLPDEDEELQARMYEECRRVLGGRGYRHYEISNFGLPGHECRHNLRYWRNDTYLGLGLGAVGFLCGRRRGNAKTIQGYRRQVEEGREWEWSEDPLSPVERVRESLILGLRLLEGVDPRAVVGNPLPEHEHAAIGRVLERWKARGLVARFDDRYALTERGLFLSNEVFSDLV